MKIEYCAVFYRFKFDTVAPTRISRKRAGQNQKRAAAKIKLFLIAPDGACQWREAQIADNLDLTCHRNIVMPKPPMIRLI
jgi:hypothetical protein